MDSVSPAVAGHSRAQVRDSPVLVRQSGGLVRDSHASLRENVGVCVVTRDLSPLAVSVAPAPSDGKSPKPSSANSHKSASTSRLSSDESQPRKTVSTQTPTLLKPSLSIQAGPSASFRPHRSRLGRSRTVTTDFFPVSQCDQSVSCSPLSFDKGTEVWPSVVDQGTLCSISMSDQGTSPSFSINFNESSHKVT